MIRITEEQSQIIFSELYCIFVSARAGTGKTTTLVELARYRKYDSILYIVYNNSIREEAKNKFPAYVEVHTIHSLAFKFIGIEYSDKITDNIQVEDILKYIDIEEEIERLKTTLHVMKILKHYLNSNAKEIKDLNYPEYLVNLAQLYWDKMKDKNNLDVMITHDGYLKLYQLSNPILNYDRIMVDEAQDSNEVMLDIVLRQSAKKIFVGDPHQKIYGFRGALNVFAGNEINYTLTESFRFGQGIADIANEILIKKNESSLLRGCDRDCFIGDIDKDVQYTKIFRTNTALFDEAVNLVQQDKKIHIIGGGDFSSILDVYNLFKGNKSKIKNQYFKTFRNYFEFKGLATSLKIPEYMYLIRLIDLYGDSLITWIEMIKSSLTGKKSADVILTTAHKAKGLEFVSVVLAEDFSFEAEEELNLVYVAITRASFDLQLSYALKKFLR